MSDDFFVGYLPVPAQTAGRMRRVAIGLVSAAALLAVLLALATGPFDRANYEYDKVTAWHGWVEAAPVPMLITMSPADSTSPFGLLRLPLVGQGKHGSAPLVAEYDRRAVRLSARRIVRGGTTMLELVPGSIERDRIELPEDGTPTPASHVEDLGRRTFSGEIVDSKCFLGVMNPGRLEVHRACALRCIAGGIPPMLFAHDDQGREAHLLLVDAEGHPLNDRILAWVARPVSLTGRLERRDTVFYLYVTDIGDTPLFLTNSKTGGFLSFS